jgi:hypothetical protein
MVWSALVSGDLAELDDGLALKQAICNPPALPVDWLGLNVGTNL